MADLQHSDSNSSEKGGEFLMRPAEVLVLADPRRPRFLPRRGVLSL